MKLNHVAIATITAVVQFFVISHTTVTCAIAVPVVDTTRTRDDDDTDRLAARFKHELVDSSTQFASRSLEDDDICSSACANGSTSVLAAEIQSDSKNQVDDGNGSTSGIFGRIFGFFNSKLGRVMNGFFSIFTRRRQRNTKYMIPTNKIVPLLSNYSTKFNSLAKMLREEGVNAAAVSSTPDAIRMMFNVSADNMESVATVLDPILSDMEQQGSMDVRDVSCGVMRILTVIRDFTVPNIERVAQVLYTNSNRTEMVDAINKYFSEKSSTKRSDITPSGTESTCADSLSKDTTARTVGSFDNIFDFLFDTEVDVGPITHIVRIVLLVVIFPLSFVVSILSPILTIIYAIFVPNASNESVGDYTWLVVLLSFIGFSLAPLITIQVILSNVVGLFQDIIDPFFTRPSENYRAQTDVQATFRFSDSTYN
jgi:hypothetical protein